MARIRTIRRYEGAAVSVGVGLVLLLAALAWGRLDPPEDAPGDDPELSTLETACVEQLHREARTTSMSPDAPGPSSRAGTKPQAAPGDPPAGLAAELRLTDYGWAARNAHLRNDACTRFYRRKLALGR